MTIGIGCDILGNDDPHGHSPGPRAIFQLPFSCVTQPATDLSRRQALKVGAGVVALAIGGGSVWAAMRSEGSPAATSGTTTATSAPPPASIAPLSASQIDALDALDKSAIAALDPAIALLGRRYLAEHPEESDPAVLLDRLPEPTEDPIAAASAAIAGEYEKGQSVAVAGWLLAISEARAAAVVALVCSGTGQC